MPQNKDLKRLVRARMKKTGEAYTAARAQLIRRKRSPTPAADFAALAGRSDAVIAAKTGRTWAEWVSALDRHAAVQLTHTRLAELLHTEYKVQDWWAQTVAVGYERIKGLRAIGQRRDGSFEASKSRTYDVPVSTLFDAWANPGTRGRWLTGATVKVRTARAPKTMRIDWNDAIVAVGFMAKGTKSAVAVQHPKLASKAEAERMKKYWTERLDALGEVLT